MNTVAEILEAIARLSPEEQREVWLAVGKVTGHGSSPVPDSFWSTLEELEQGR